MVKSNRRVRSAVAFGLAIGLLVAACGSSNNNPLGNNGGNGGNGGAQSLSAGLAANLDKLDSYQFSWSVTGGSSTDTPADTGVLGNSGIVVNKPVKAYKINAFGTQIIAIGGQAWTSDDNGATWTASTNYSATDSSLTSMLPMSMYTSIFDTKASQFTVKGNENKNGVDCIHYQGNVDLGALGAMAGVTGNFQSDLWVAKNGNYPVSGFYGFTGTAKGQSGSYGQSFNITHVNDAANNTVTAPANVVAIPS